jgi:hypothetical protein
MGEDQIMNKNIPFDHGIQGAKLDFQLSRISGPGCHKYGKINTYPFSQVVANE